MSGPSLTLRVEIAPNNCLALAHASGWDMRALAHASGWDGWVLGLAHASGWDGLSLSGAGISTPKNPVRNVR